MGKNNAGAVSEKANTSAHVQVLGVGADTGCTVPSVLLFFDRKRYLFNVGEGFQRFCVEHKVKMTKVSSVLSTRATTHTLGGLPGMLLTMRDATAGGLLSGMGGVGYDVHGPPGLKTASGAFKTFVSFKELGVKVREVAGDENGEGTLVRHSSRVCGAVVENESVVITPVLIWDGAAVGQGRCNGEAESEPDAKRVKMAGQNGQDQNHRHDREQTVVSYVCQLPDIPGKFLPQKAASLGVPRGPLYGKLQKGESVEAANGQMVHPKDVMEPSTPGPTVLVVDCPSVGHVEGLREGMQAWSEDTEKRQKVAVVVHLTSRDVLRDSKYVEFIESFPDPTQHMLVSESMVDKAPIMRKSAMLHAKLQYLDPDAFQPLHHGLGDESVFVKQSPVTFPENCRTGSNMLKYTLRPVAKRGFSDEEVDREEIDREAIARDLVACKPGVEEIAKRIHAFSTPVAPCPSIPGIVTSDEGNNVSFTFLGTGAAIPSKYRNVTSILLRNQAKDASILMDCGEASLGQLYKRFGQQETEEILKSLRFVWISHIHADHHMGLASIIGARSRVLGDDCEPLLVIGPRPLRKTLGLYSTLEPMKFSYVEASMTEVRTEAEGVGGGGPGGAAGGEADATAGLLERAKTAMGVKRLESVRVEHCSHAFGLVLESSDFDHAASKGWKIVFSGDTRPCPQLTKAAENSTVLIHEATFEDTMSEEAMEKRHSTTGEAITAGRESNSYMTFLTHFSQRYPKIPVIDDTFSGKVAVAFDLMTVRLTDLPRVPLITPGVKLLFEDEDAKEREAREANKHQQE